MAAAEAGQPACALRGGRRHAKRGALRVVGKERLELDRARAWQPDAWHQRACGPPR